MLLRSHPRGNVVDIFLLVILFGSGGRSDLSVLRLRPSADSSPARSSPPLNPLRFSAFRPLRPPLPLLRFAQIGVAPFRATCLRLAPPSRPERCPAPSLRRSSSRPFRRSLSPADCPPVRSSRSLARLGMLTFALRACCRSLLRGSCLRLVPRLRQNPLRRSLPQELRAAGSSPPLPAAPLPSREPAGVEHRLRRLRRCSTPADSLSVRSASAVRSPRLPRPPAAPCHFGVQPPQAPAEPSRAHSASPARTGAGSLSFRLRATCPFTPAGSWRSAGYTASLRRPFPGQIATPARFPPRSAQPARPLPSSSGASRAAQPSCGVRSRAD